MQLEGPTAAGFMYSDAGGNGAVVVLLHGVLMNGTLWDGVVGGLGDRYRCIVPELPFGAHSTPTPDDADLTRLLALVVHRWGFVARWPRSRRPRRPAARILCTAEGASPSMCAM